MAGRLLTRTWQCWTRGVRGQHRMCVSVQHVPSLRARWCATVTTGGSGSGSGGETKEPKRFRVYTRGGDKGKSWLFSGERRLKSDPVFAALGDTDELNAAIGVARCHVESVDAVMDEQLAHIQSRILDVGSAVATPLSCGDEASLARAAFPADQAKTLEQWIDAMDEELPVLRNFILPSGGLAAAHLHVARTVCRRAERAVQELVVAGEVPAPVGVFMNRLSDYLFTAARLAAQRSGQEETVYKKTQHQD